MNSDPGLFYGLIFGATLFVGSTLWVWMERRSQELALERAHPIEPGSGEQLLARVAAMAQPTLLLIPAGEGCFSKLGGDPELPPGIDWPAGVEASRAFLAQVDLAEFQGQIEWLPGEGRIYAFFDPSAFGAPDLVKVVYRAEQGGPPVPAPVDVPARYSERRVEFASFTSFPSDEWLEYEGRIDMDDDAFETRLDAFGVRPPGEELLHRIGGYPDEIQNGCLRLEAEHLARGLPAVDYGLETAPAIERASKEWRLLLQIDSDPDLGMEFGDAGRFYVFIRERHARAGDFSKTVTLFQCY